jgi:hypothetical protein
MHTVPPNLASLTAAGLRQLALDCGADDAGCVALDRKELDDQRADILRCFPPTRTLLSIVCRMNREPIRSVDRSVANLEFHETTDRVNGVTRSIVAALERQGVRALRAYPNNNPIDFLPGSAKVEAWRNRRNRNWATACRRRCGRGWSR